MMGERLFALSLNLLKGTSASMDVSGLASGIYFVKAFDGKKVVMKKFVKM
jgi:hypothetical protein